MGQESRRGHCLCTGGIVKDYCWLIRAKSEVQDLNVLETCRLGAKVVWSESLRIGCFCSCE